MTEMLRFRPVCPVSSIRERAQDLGKPGIVARSANNCRTTDTCRVENLWSDCDQCCEFCTGICSVAAIAHCPQAACQMNIMSHVMTCRRCSRRVRTTALRRSGRFERHPEGEARRAGRKRRIESQAARCGGGSGEVGRRTWFFGAAPLGGGSSQRPGAGGGKPRLAGRAEPGSQCASECLRADGCCRADRWGKYRRVGGGRFGGTVRSRSVAPVNPGFGRGLQKRQPRPASRLSPARKSGLTDRDGTGAFGRLGRPGRHSGHAGPGVSGSFGNADAAPATAVYPGVTRVGHVSARGAIHPRHKTGLSLLRVRSDELRGQPRGTEDQEGVRRHGLRVHAPGAFCFSGGGLSAGGSALQDNWHKKARRFRTGLFVRRQIRAPHPGK